MSTGRFEHCGPPASLSGSPCLSGSARARARLATSKRALYIEIPRLRSRTHGKCRAFGSWLDHSLDVPQPEAAAGDGDLGPGPMLPGCPLPVTRQQ